MVNAWNTGMFACVKVDAGTLMIILSLSNHESQDEIKDLQCDDLTGRLAGRPPPQRKWIAIICLALILDLSTIASYRWSPNEHS